MRQDQALHLLKMGKNVFLTGAAGAGKTYLLNQYIHYLKKHAVTVSVTASTGIAATHLQGTTIHAWSGIGIRDVLTEKDLEKLLATSHIKRNYRKTKVLIIDEISMLHPHQLDMVDQAARFILANDEPFGGMQIVLCGDFFQLPPVGEPRNEMKFAYQANSWREANITVCYLAEQHRQSDDLLLTILNDIRNGKAGEHTKVPLRTRYKKEPAGAMKATKLYAKNVNVDVINDDMLSGLPGKERIFTMSTKGFSKLVEGLKKSCLAPERLRLKIGAEVMFVKNDPKGAFVNGTRGIVTAFEKSPDEFPIVKTYDQRYVTVVTEDWKYEENGVIRAMLSQIPLRHAWAITIHKSQGMTLDAVEMDLGDTFEPGMGYVALSRVRSLSGLKLMNLNEMALKVHPKILQDDVLFKNQSQANCLLLENMNEAERKTIQDETLFMRFGGLLEGEAHAATATREKKIKKKKIPNHMMTLELVKEKYSLESIAEKLGFTIGTIIRHVEKLQGLEALQLTDMNYLKDNFAPEDFLMLLNAFKESVDGRLTPIFEKFKGKFSFEQLHIVRLFVNEC
ncbi:MAG: AAA family ATPase [Gammaproteobacteria bacterium]|nr:AAA family ATPase [Gammaproteobacteria bacterium]